MADITMTFSVDERLKTAFEETARVYDLSRDDLLRRMMEDYVYLQSLDKDYDDWFRQGVRESIASADAGDVVPHDQIEEEFAALREDALRKARA